MARLGRVSARLKTREGVRAGAQLRAEAAPETASGGTASLADTLALYTAPVSTCLAVEALIIPLRPRVSTKSALPSRNKPSTRGVLPLRRPAIPILVT